MRLLLACVLLSVALNAALTVATASSPLFLWSGRRIFATHSQAGEVLNSQDLDSLLKAVGGQEKTSASRFASYLESSRPSTPEVILAFVNSQVGAGSSSASDLSNLKDTLSTAASSVSAPYFTASGRVATELSSSITKLSANSQIVPAQLGSDSTSDCQTLLARLGADKFASIFSNGVPDLVLVESSDVSSTNECIRALNDKVNQLTSGNYLGLFTAESAAPAIRTSFASPVMLQASAPISGSGSRPRIQSTYTAENPGPQYITPDILIGLLVAAMLLGVLTLAVYCVATVQAPVRFASQRLNVGKEY